MKKLIISMLLILLLALLSACSSQPSLQLINSTVSITNDEHKIGSIIITEGDKKGQELFPTALYYEFTIKNAGNKSIGDIEDGKGLEIEIVPNKKLKATSKEVVSFNIFDTSAYVDKGVGYVGNFTPILKPEEEGKFVLYYELGVSEKISQVPLMAPSADKLKKLKDDALDASLVVMLEGKEVARFALTEK